MTIDAVDSMWPSEDSAQAGFLKLPIEIRLMIYSHLLLPPANAIHTTAAARILPSASDYFNYEPASSSPSTPSIKHSSTNLLKIRTEDPTSYQARRPSHVRTRYMIRSDRFRARCMHTTYCLLSNPSLFSSILHTNARIHAEAAETLYGGCVFDFDNHVEAVVPFFSDLTPIARSYVRGVRLVKRALPYEKEFDRAEWANAISYLADNVPLRSLDLGIVAGKPASSGWEGVEPYVEMDWRYLKEMDGMEWVNDLLAIKGLERLDIRAVVEHCPPPMSTAMARYIKFSASVEGSFSDYLQGVMVA